MKLLKIQEEVVYKLVHDDGTAVHPAIEEKANELSQLLKDAKVLGDSSNVSSIVAMRIASVVLGNYELRTRYERVSRVLRNRRERSTDTSNDETSDLSIPLKEPID